METDAARGLCTSCFAERGGSGACPSCGYVEPDTTQLSSVALPPRTILLDQFVVGHTLRKPTRRGIVYVGWDTNLRMRVLIDEYLPIEFAARSREGTAVTPVRPEATDVFLRGMEDFLADGRRLRQTNHRNIVRVLAAFRANDTAYIVSEFEEGVTLRDHVRAAGPIAPADVARMLFQLADGLAAVHARDYVHLQVQPQHIRLTTGGVPVLMEFAPSGIAAREEKEMMAVSGGAAYAGLEQYTRKGELGPWTDVYGLCATGYWMLTGTAPPQITERLEEDALAALDAPTIPVGLAGALRAGLALHADRRVRDMRTLQKLLSGAAAGTPGGSGDLRRAAPEGGAGATIVIAGDDPRRRAAEALEARGRGSRAHESPQRGGNRWQLWVLVATAVAVCAALLLLLGGRA